MAQYPEKCDHVMERFNEACGKVKKIYEAGKLKAGKLKASEKKECLFWDALSKRVGEIERDISDCTSPSSCDTQNYRKQISVTKDNHGPLSEQPIASPPVQAAQPPKMLSDATLRKMVSSFYQSGLFNLLKGVPQEIKINDQVMKHVQEVTMDMHKQACDKLWDLVRPQLSSKEVRSLLIDEFVPTLKLPSDSTEMEAFKDWFQLVHCGPEEPHPPSDVRSILSTMEAVTNIRNKALEVRQTPADCTVLYKQLSTGLEADCLKCLEKNGMLKMHAQKNLQGLACEICQVVSAMLLHSSPIIPFTKLDSFFSIYHEPTRYAREDPNGCSVLVYRTPFLFCYHYGELKTVHKASVTFEIPPEKLSTPLPIFKEQDLLEKVKVLFQRDLNYLDYYKANKKTDSFVGWYHFANETLTKAMQKKPLLTKEECQLLSPLSVNPGYLCVPEILKAFSKRHRLLAEQSSLLTSSGLEKKLTEHIRASSLLLDQEAVYRAVQLVIALLCSPDLWIPYGIKHVPNFIPSFHTEVTADYEQHRANVYQAGHVTCGQPPHTKRQPQFPIKCYLRPLLVKFATGKNEPLFPPRVILK